VEGLVIDPQFWKDRKVFITGHKGFKGSWLSLWLGQLGAKVSAYSLAAPTSPSMFQLANVKASLAKSIHGDIRDTAALTSAMLEAEPEIVIHLAAQSLVRDSYTDPVETYSTNVMGTVNLLEAIRKTPGVKAVLNITSDKCYENRNLERGYREDEPMGGFDPYSSSKGCAELVSSAYRRSFLQDTGIALATARAGNVIGGGDWAKDRIVPDAIRAFIKKQTLIVRNPLAIRPWQHVLEPLSGYLMLCQQLINHPEEHAKGWNFGPNDEDAQTVSSLAEFMTKSWGGGAKWQLDKGAHPYEAQYLKLDCSLAKTELKWNPIWGLERALDETVQWYKSWHNKNDMRKISLQQISAYQQEHVAA